MDIVVLKLFMLIHIFLISLKIQIMFELNSHFMEKLLYRQLRTDSL